MARIEIDVGYDGDPSADDNFLNFIHVLNFIWTAGSSLLDLAGLVDTGLYTPAHVAACSELDGLLAGGRCAQNDALAQHFAASFAQEPRGRRPGVWFFPTVPQILVRLFRLDPASTANFETTQQRGFLDLFDEGAGMPAYSRDYTLGRFGYAAHGIGGMRPLAECKVRWGLVYAQLMGVPFNVVHAALAALLADAPDLSVLSADGHADYLMRLAHVSEQARYAAALVAQGADADNGVLYLLRIGANDPEAGLPLERVHEQLKVSDDGRRLERVSEGKSDSMLMGYWAGRGATELKLRYLGAAPHGCGWHFSCELAAGRCVPAVNGSAPSLNVTAVGKGTGGW